MAYRVRLCRCQARMRMPAIVREGAGTTCHLAGFHKFHGECPAGTFWLSKKCFLIALFAESGAISVH